MMKIKHFKKEEYWDISADFTTKDQEKFKARLSQIDAQKLEKLSNSKCLN